jgi:hypothetical protein
MLRKYRITTHFVERIGLRPNDATDLGTSSIGGATWSGTRSLLGPQLGNHRSQSENILGAAIQGLTSRWQSEKISGKT